MTMLVCRICSNSIDNKLFTIKEMMIGLKNSFEYIECSNCGCFQIREYPVNIAQYYPKEYYSFEKRKIHKHPPWKRFLKSHRARYFLQERDFLGRFLSIINPEPEYIKWLRLAEVNLESRIMEIGCGSGATLIKLNEEGFINLSGIDPFLEDDIIYENAVAVRKATIYDLNEKYDLILMNHSFEHMPQPLKVFKKISQALEDSGGILIRMPVAGSFAWRQYGVNWVQIDAPRHFYIHTEKSLKILAENSGFILKNTVYDSGSFQFWGSEQYKKGIPLNDRMSYLKNPDNSIFTKEQIDCFKKKATELNFSSQGDQACFYLYKRNLS